MFLLPALAECGVALHAQDTTGMQPALPAAVRPGDVKEVAKSLIKQGRIYMQQGNLVMAQQCALQARQMQVSWDISDDTPDKMLGDIAALSSRTPAQLASMQTPADTAKPATPAVSYPSDPRQMLKMGRDALKSGNLDLARDLGTRASATNTRWGLFEDSPAKLLNDVAKQRQEHDHKEAERLLVEARKLYQRGDLEKAAELALKSERLHNGAWDITDRPQKLLAEIADARARQPRQPVAARNDVASPALPTLNAQARPTNLPPSIVGTAPAAPGMNPARQKAMTLMAEARLLSGSNRFVEARNKVVEAQALHAEFGPEEDQPARLLLELNGEAQKRIDAAVGQAMTALQSDHSAPMVAQVHSTLTQAKAFAVAMNLSTIAIDEKMTWLAQASTSSQPAATPIASAPAAPTQQPIAQLPPSAVQPGNTPAAPSAQSGKQMLENAQTELSHGNLETARKLAEEVFAGPYNLRSEAGGMLRSIEAAAFNQKVLAANQAYDAGMAEFSTGHYAQANGIFLQIDATLLTDSRRQIMKDKMLEAGTLMTKSTMSMPKETPNTTGTIQLAGTPPAVPNVGIPVAPNTPGTARITDQPVPTGPAGVPAVSHPVIVPMPPSQAAAPTAPIASVPTAPSTPAPASDGYADQMKALQEVEFQRLRVDGLKVQREAQARFSKGETDAAIQLLADHLTKLRDAGLSPNHLAMLQRPIEYRLQSFKVLKAQKDAELALEMRHSKQADKIAKRAEAEDNRHKQVAELMKQFNALMDEGKFKDAEMLAMKAHELEPEADAPNYAINLAKMAGRHKLVDDDKANKEEMVFKGLRSTDDQGPYVGDVNDPLKVDPDRLKINRQGDRTLGLKTKSEKEKEIERRLSTPVNIDFRGATLQQVINDLHVMTKLNIVPALEAIRDENPRALEQPIQLKLDDVSLKSALNILLRQAHLTYVIQDDALQITTERAARGKLVQKVYSVADLVIPIDNYAIANPSNLMKKFEESGQHPTTNGITTGSTPGLGLPAGSPVSPGTQLSTQPSSPGSATSASPTGASTYQTLAKNTLEDVLMKLIANTVAPQSWNDVGGPGTIDYFPIGMALVINQTPDVQEQVAELLEALRRLQDLEVAVEVRIITVAETFFERIGMDFNLNILTKNSAENQAQLTTGQFQPLGNVNSFEPNKFVSGLTPAGTFTNDLNIPIKATSFNMAIPPFGGYPNAPGANGGLSLGLAFLNEIQVYMFMEAAQGDRRTNVMHAPKLTLFNGQTSTIQVQDFQFFVTGVTVTSVNGQIVFTPNNTPFPVGQVALNGSGANGVGINMAIQAVITADRRYVRLNLSPTLSSLASATVPLFPVTTIVTPILEGGFVGQPIPFTQFIQQPSFAFINTQTTVMVPDGGTVLMGGIKSLSEGRNEFGPPILSKIPYLNRLVKNTGYGREAQSMMIMVTPRIIINSEEAERQTGELPSNQ
jgi:type II secretory pathway component GspD/PulD (secretin)